MLLRHASLPLRFRCRHYFATLASLSLIRYCRYAFAFADIDIYFADAAIDFAADAFADAAISPLFRC